MRNGQFVSRSELGNYEWDHEKKNWVRPHLDREVLKELSQRSTVHGLTRLALFIGFQVLCLALALYVASFALALAILPLYVFYFFYGFWASLGHELQHKTVFGKSFDWLNEAVFFVAQTITWNSPRYARISHTLHHRYTMVRGMDPETDWPKVITTRWLNSHLWGLILQILVVGAIKELVSDIAKQVTRAIGLQDELMKNHCTESDLRRIRLESLAILAVHVSIATLAVVFGWWALLVFVTIGFQIGAGIEKLWHQTEHIGMAYDVNDHRLNTRSVQVGWLVALLYWGLDDHVEHHLFPAVPSKNLPRLRKILSKDLAYVDNVAKCWAEMYAISREKVVRPDCEFVPEFQRGSEPLA